jgi:hypothetical protein
MLDVSQYARIGIYELAVTEFSCPKAEIKGDSNLFLINRCKG